jgi:predicted enzyme related to lactoylglutathione lyase
VNTEPPRYKHLTPMLCVRDLSASIPFYRKLGFEVEMEEDHIALMALDEMRLYLFTESLPTEDKPKSRLVPQADPITGNVIVVLAVDDCGRAHRALTKRGVAFLTEPKSPPWGGWRCFAQDPDGYLIEIEES